MHCQHDKHIARVLRYHKDRRDLLFEDGCEESENVLSPETELLTSLNSIILDLTGIIGNAETFPANVTIESMKRVHGDLLEMRNEIFPDLFDEALAASECDCVECNQEEDGR